MRPIDGRLLLRALAGLGVWALCFVVLYGGLSLGCQAGLGARQWGALNALSVLLALLWLAHAVWLGVLLVRAWRRRRVSAPDGTVGFMHALTLGLDAAAGVALLALLAPVLMLAPCA